MDAARGGVLEPRSHGTRKFCASTITKRERRGRWKSHLGDYVAPPEISWLRLEEEAVVPPPHLRPSTDEELRGMPASNIGCAIGGLRRHTEVRIYSEVLIQVERRARSKR